MYSVGTIATNQICPQTKATSPFTIASGQTVKVQPGCQIQTMDHVITAEDSDDFEIQTTWLDWTMTLAQLFDHEDTEQLMHLVKQIRSTISGTFDASELLQRLDALNEPFQSHHWLFSSPAAMIGIVLIIALISFVVYKKCFPKSPHKQTDSSTPSAPPPSDLQSQELAMLRDLYNYNNRPGTNPAAIPQNQPGQQKPIQLPKSITIINSLYKGGEQKISFSIFTKFLISRSFHSFTQIAHFTNTTHTS